MTFELREERVRELGEESYLVLKESYQSVRELKALVERLHAAYLRGDTSQMDVVGAVKLTVDRLYDDLERYLRPGVDPDSAYDDARTENS
ncbi:MAG TPA: hypothetical protein DCZ75_15680 [Geobacter sp.]|nr:hypothetical protein [Geobacter sp.]